jgi:hypothetical protein
MAPRTSTVLRVRWVLRVFLRLAAAGLVILFLWRIANHAGVYWGSDLSNFLQFGLYRSLAPLGAAGALLLLDIVALRWLIPAGRWQCPRCGYDLENVSKPKCPECGQRLSSEVLGAPADAEAGR